MVIGSSYQVSAGDVDRASERRSCYRRQDQHYDKWRESEGRERERKGYMERGMRL